MSKTTSFQRLGTAGLAALAVVGLLTGCSSKKKAAATSSTGSTVSSAAAAAATSAAGAAATSAAPSQSKVVATGGGKFCKDVASAVNNAAAKNALTGGADSLKQSVQNFKSIEGSVLGAAPNEIKPDLVTLFGALDQFYAALQKANFDFTKIDPSVEAPLQSPAVQQAEQHVTDYMKNTCGIDIGAGTDNSSAQAAASAAVASALANLTGSPKS